MALSDETERAVEFPFADWLLGVEDAGNRLAGRVRHCSRSAFVHLRKAWRLHGVDDEMSAFRAITAEEEAATALITDLFYAPSGVDEAHLTHSVQQRLAMTLLWVLGKGRGGEGRGLLPA